ncbi:MAG: hypothetical protein K9L70_09095 [Thiohalocapsa sp.]|jgi:hypothetical protein|nr:hypothetical protein [Thiohalocapsa sp.]MCF7991319.1 hypothetical protein [Thiohalocapsa sp.]
MTRGIQLKALSANDLGHLGLSADAFRQALEMIDEIDTDADVPDPRAITREVRGALEEALALLTDALPAERR